jgi:uncharacterized protein DUF4446
VAALAVAIVAIVAIQKARTAPTVPEPVKPARPVKQSESAPPRADLGRLRDEVATLRLELADALRHLAVVRYDAFGEMGGHLSWSMALLDDHGDGVVLTSINGRNDSRSYAKNVREFTGDAKLSPEETEAIEYLRKEAVG